MVCTDNVLDLVFVVDSSGSIEEAEGGLNNWELVKSFISNVVDFLDVGENNVRIGLVNFSNLVLSVFKLNTSYLKSDIKDLVADLGFIGGTTDTAGALREMMEVQFTEANGDRPNVPNVVVLITDGGHSAEFDPPIPEAEKAHAEGIQIITVGITNQINETELREISSPPQLLGSNYFISDDFMSLDVDVRDALIVETCSAVSGKLIS